MWTLGGCLNKWLFCWKDLWIPISRQTVTRLTRQEGTRTGRVRTEAPGQHLFCTSTGALAATSSSTTSDLPSAAAWCSGVLPRPDANTLWGKAQRLPFFWETSSRSRSISTKSIWTDREKNLSAQSWQSPFNRFYMLYLQMVNRTCSKPKSLEGAAFSPSFRYIWKSYENPITIT